MKSDEVLYHQNKVTWKRNRTLGARIKDLYGATYFIICEQFMIWDIL